MRLFGLLIAFAFWPAAVLHAQGEVPVEPGTRVRVSLAPQAAAIEGAAPPQLLRGTVQTASIDSLVVAIHPGAAPVRLAWSAVRRMDRSRGVPSRVESVLRGAVGTAALAVVYLPIFDDREDTKFFDTRLDDRLSHAVFGAVTGAVLGALRPRERWKRIRLPRPAA